MNGDAVSHANKLSLATGYVLGAMGFVVCFIIAFQMDGERGLNVLIAIFGSAAGWSTGMLISPYRTEQSQFLDFRKSVSTFVSGFLLAKLDALFQSAVARNLVISATFADRVLIFATTFVICLQFTYVSRRYVGKPIPSPDR